MDTTRFAQTPDRRSPKVRRAAVALAALLVVAACGSDDDDTADDATATATTDQSVADSTVATTAATTTPGTTEVAAVESTTTVGTTAPPTTAAPPTTVDDSWMAEVTASCNEFDSYFAALPPHDGTPAGVAAFADQIASFEPTGTPLESIDYPDGASADVDEALTLLDESNAAVTDAIELAAAGDVAGADHALSMSFDLFRRSTGYFATAGAACFEADPARMAAAGLIVRTELDTSQLATAFDSVWLSQVLGNHLVRVDPDDGSVIATIEVGETPIKAQPADGLLWVRTAAQYDAIDPETNTVVRTLAKADVGPQANRSWATDGALWICDGQQLHRYDPATLERVTTVELEIDCGQVTVGDGLVIAWTYNEDPGDSGTSAAAIIDGATNDTLATVALPVDSGVPVVLDDDVFFPGNSGPVAVAVQRSDWTIRSTHDLGRPTGGSLSVTDGSQIFVPTPEALDVLVVDAGTYEVVDTIETQGANSVALLDGSLWTAASHAGVAQRFDL